MIDDYVSDEYWWPDRRALYTVNQIRPHNMVSPYARQEKIERLTYDPYRDGASDGWDFDEWYWSYEHDNTTVAPGEVAWTNSTVASRLLADHDLHLLPENELQVKEIKTETEEDRRIEEQY